MPSSLNIEFNFKNGRLYFNDKILAKKIFDKTSISWLEKEDYISCPAIDYRRVFKFLVRKKIDFTDKAREYDKIDVKKNSTELFGYQHETLQKWLQAKWGIAVLPTGSGKTVIALKALEHVGRSCIILVPTIDLIWQWHKVLTDSTDLEIGTLGGGSKNIKSITISTYASASLYADKIGAKFCLLIFDEVHHASSHLNIKMACKFIAPYRLGLSATLPEEPVRLENLKVIVGQVIAKKHVEELAGKYLASFSLKKIEVDLSLDESIEYEKHRSIYLNFRQKLNTLDFGKASSWRKFVLLAHRSLEGRKAIKSFSVQKKIAFSAQAKFDKLKELLDLHATDKILIFTNDNETALKISTDFGIACIIHGTKIKERREILKKFRGNELMSIVSSRVLNEGIDVPSVSVAIIFSGSSTTREYMQRLGRILRKNAEKKAYLYELITAGTSEVYTSQRRNRDLDFKNMDKIFEN